MITMPFIVAGFALRNAADLRSRQMKTNQDIWKDYEKEEREKREKEQINDEWKMLIVTLVTLFIGTFVIWLLVKMTLEALSWALT